MHAQCLLAMAGLEVTDAEAAVGELEAPRDPMLQLRAAGERTTKHPGAAPHELEALAGEIDRALHELVRVAQAIQRARTALAAHLCSSAEDVATGTGAVDTVAPASPLVIDGVRHEVTARGVRVSLASRVVPRRLLYAFLDADGHLLDRSAISRALWGTDYMLRHDSAIKSNIRRLRHLLAGTRVVIRADEEGYRLEMPPGCVFVRPRS